MNGIEDSEFIQDAYIQEGVSPKTGIIIVACTIGDDYDNPKNRVGVKKDAVWLEFGLSGEAILSIDASADGLAYVLGENGTIVRFNWDTPLTKDELRASRSLFTNPTVSGLGPLRRLRVIGSDVISAGSVGQVYLLRNEKIEALPPLKVMDKGVTIEDMAGHDRNDLVVVTSDGYAAHFNGSHWRVLDLPTNASLTSICKMADDRYAISGKNGTIVIGIGDTWQLISPIDEERSYWGIAEHAGAIYAAHLGGVDKVLGQKLSPVKIPFSEQLSFTVLRGNKEGVWSFAEQTIGLIQGDQWTTLLK